MRLLTALTIILVLQCLAGNTTEPTHLLKQPYHVQFPWLDSVRDRSNHIDSATAVTTFDQLEKWAGSKNDKQLALGFRLMKFRRLKDHGKNVESLEGPYKELLSEVEKTDFDELRADILYGYADVLWENKSYSKSIEYYIHAYNLALTLETESYPNIGELACTLGGRFYYFRDFPAASKYLSDYWRITPKKYQKQEISKYNTLALSFTNQHAYDSALFYFTLAEKEAVKIDHKFWIALIGGNKAYSYFMQGKYDLAIPLFQKEIVDNAGTPEAANSMVNLGAIYLMKGKVKEAYDLQMEAYEILKKAGMASNYNVVRNSYPSIASTLAAMGNYQLAYRFLDSARLATDTVNTRRNMLYISGVQHKIEADKHLQALQQKNVELKMQRSQRNLLLAGVAALGLFVLIILRQKKRITAEKKRSDDLLLNILPYETAEELKKTGAAKARNYEMVTVLFTDFEDFTETSEHLTAEELVGEINYCYSEFDKILSKYGVEKIKTIGDSYMCAGGLPRVSQTHAEDVVAVAIEIVKFMEKEKEKRRLLGKTYFEMRLGIHTGPVVAGIVGIKKFAYDIWGDTVNVASRMESSGEPGKINISESTYERVKDRFKCTYRGELNAKNKGMLKMYFVEPSLPERKENPLTAEADLSI